MSSAVRWRCRRGMLELDFIFHRFFDERYEALSDDQKTIFETLQKQEDPLLFDWLITGVSCPDATLQKLIDQMRDLSES